MAPAPALNVTLAGDWTLCEGDLLEGATTLRFDGQGGISLLDTAGKRLGATTYRPVYPMTIPDVYLTTALLFDTQPPGDWDVVFSERPLKLWVRSPASEQIYRNAIFSAVP